MISQKDFLRKYNIDQRKFNSTGLIWEELVKLHDDYTSIRNTLEKPTISIMNKLMKVDKVHYVRYRIKSAEHLVEKIINKRRGKRVRKHRRRS